MAPGRCTFTGVTPVLAIGLLLAGCQSAPPLDETTAWQARQAQLLALDSWQLQGRVNARYQDESHTPRIRWQQDNEHYEIRLWGTLNAGATRIEGRPGMVTFEQGGDIQIASTPEELVLDNLGYELPVSQLEYWIRGLPTPGEEHSLSLGEFNEVLAMQQSGWTLHYADYRLFGEVSLPRRIEMSREENSIRLTFLGLNWTFE